MALADFFYMSSCPLAGYLALKVKNNKILFLAGILFSGLSFILIGPNNNILHLP